MHCFEDREENNSYDIIGDHWPLAICDLRMNQCGTRVCFVTGHLIVVVGRFQVKIFRVNATVSFMDGCWTRYGYGHSLLRRVEHFVPPSSLRTTKHESRIAQSNISILVEGAHLVQPQTVMKSTSFESFNLRSAISRC